MKTTGSKEHRQLLHPPQAWEAAKADYLAGATAWAIQERYGIREGTFRKRLSREGIAKSRQPYELPPSLAGERADEAAARAAAEGALSGEDGEAPAWAEIAHPAQTPPPGAWSTWLFQGGRGAGKTRAGAEWLAARAAASPGGRFALVGPTLHDVREVMIEGPSGLARLPGRTPPVYEASRRRLVWESSGAVAYAFSAEEPRRLRGPQFEAAWADEFCAWPKPEETLALLRMGLRLGADPRLVVTTTPRPIGALRRLKAEASCVETRAGTAANAANLAPSFLAGLRALYGGTRLAAQELDGVMVERADGALWRAAELARCRGALPAGGFERVVVAVDPPAGTASGEGGAACGIVVAARLEGRAYVLADRTEGGLSPYAWARRAADAAREFGAAEVVAEANQGGDMVRATLVGAGVDRPLRLVRASTGKRARAEPVSALYEQGRVVHCGAFPALEEELLALGGEGEGAEGDGRLDRADALVWALTALMLEGMRAGPRISVL